MVVRGLVRRVVRGVVRRVVRGVGSVGSLRSGGQFFQLSPDGQLSLLSLMFNMISDIDECEGEVHNCSSNAVCNNTKGSYNCTCKPGYEGDGDNCTGNFFHNFVILHTIESIAVFIFP